MSPIQRNYQRYGNRKPKTTWVNGIRFDSKLESDIYLKLLTEYSEVIPHPNLVIHGKLKTELDFYIPQINKYVEVKGIVIKDTFVRILVELQMLKPELLSKMVITVDRKIIDTFCRKKVVSTSIKQGLVVTTHSNLLKTVRSF